MNINARGGGVRLVRAGLLALCIAGAAPLAAAPVGTIKRMVGEVSIVRGGEARAATPGARLEAADEVRTGANGGVGIVLNDNSAIALGPDSQYVIEAFEFDPTTHDGAFASRLGKGSLAMVSGKLAARSPDAVTVRTPATTLGVRGTRLAIEVP